MSRTEWVALALEGLQELANCSYRNMCLIHHPPHRSIYAGGSGIAYTLWKAACLLDDPEWLHHARFWIDHVAAAVEDERTMTLPEDPEQTAGLEIGDSFFLGNRGVSFVQVLVAYTEDNPLLLKRAMREFIQPESRRLKIQELFQGIAGRLLGTALLFAETGDDRFRDYGNSLAGDLLETADAASGFNPWQRNKLLGFAHGRAGNYYALLKWSQETGYAPPDWVWAALRKYAQSGRKKDHGISWPIDESNEKKYMNTWCNGAPGLILLWSLAYEVCEDALFLDTARAAAEYTLHEQEHRLGGLCCGAAGVSYAFLALSRIDPHGPWLHHAHRYCDLAVQGVKDPYARLSLYRGSAGVICLMLDMQNPEEAMMPTVEG